MLQNCCGIQSKNVASDWETVEVVGSGLGFLLNRQQVHEIELLCAVFEYKSAPLTPLIYFCRLVRLSCA